MMTAMSTSAISVSGLRKAYGDKVVLGGIDLDVRPGTVFSLLGPNGAGKTTTVNVLTTLLQADGGTARVAGHDVATEAKAVRALIGVTGQFAAVDELLTGQENLQLMADLKHMGGREGKRVITELLERFDLAESAGTPMEALFVDEGFGTLDEDTLDEVMNVLDGLRAGGRIVGIVSHVTELRQRIPAQVHVRKGRAGSHVEITPG